MVPKVTYTFFRGETIQIYLDVASGDAGVITSISADLRPFDGRSRQILESSAAQAHFSLIQYPETWLLQIDASESKQLPPGAYVTDVRIELNDAVVIADPLLVVIAEPATVQA